MQDWTDYYTFTEGVTLSNRFSSEITAWWRRRFGPFDLRPCTLCQLLTADLPPDHVYLVTQIDPAMDTTRVELHGNDNGSEPVFVTERSIDFPELQVHLNFSAVRPDCQDKGYGILLVRNCFRLARLLNLGRLAVNSIQAGSYVWARAAFLPTPERWNSIDFKEMLVRQLESIPTLAWESHVNAKNLILSNDVESIWTLADLKDRVESVQFPGTKISLGRFLLAEGGVSWRGTLNFDDPTQVKRARIYLGLNSDD